MQADINGLSGPLGVVGIEIQERIKGRSWVGIQKCFPQSRLAGFARGHVLPLTPRNETPVVIGIGVPLITRVVSPTVNGLNGFEIGTLIPLGLKPMLVPGFLNGSGTNGTGASDVSKNERTYLKSPNTVRYLSHRSRVNEP